MARISRDSFLSAVSSTEVVDVPELGGEVEIRGLTVAQRDGIARSAKKKGDSADLDATLKTVIEGMVDPKLDASDYDALKALPTAVVERVAGRILRLSGMTAEAQAEILGK